MTQISGLSRRRLSWCAIAAVVIAASACLSPAAAVTYVGLKTGTMMNRNADIDSGSYVGLFVGGREDMKYGSVAVELERFIPVYKGDFGPTFGDESFPITVDWGVEGWGLYATYQIRHQAGIS